MLATTFQILLVAALLASYASLSRRVDERLGGAVSSVLWALVALGAFDHSVVTNDGTVVQMSTPALAYLAAGFGLVMIAFTFAAASGQLPDVRNTRYGDLK